ncbi:hypothetical protein Btru_039008 [Bulinus truncatus]|nr:hypothetical protein Btru_039008 [Bulinus truncatus]
MTSPVTLFKKMNLINSKTRSFRVVILGQNGVGKTALTVRFLTRRYIGDYHPLLEGVYTCQRCLDGTNVEFEVWDTAGQNENSKLKEQIRWADAIILIYDVTDRCSFNECSQLKFLTQELSRRAKQKYFTDTRSENLDHLPVVLVGNKIDKEIERMVSYGEGETKSRQLNCVAFRELSVSETVQGVTSLFEELYLYCRSVRKLPPHHASTSRLNLLADQLATCSSSDEDLAERKSISLPVTPESNEAGKLDATRLDCLADDTWVKSRSRRREALFMS